MNWDYLAGLINANSPLGFVQSVRAAEFYQCSGAHRITYLRHDLFKENVDRLCVMCNPVLRGTEELSRWLRCDTKDFLRVPNMNSPHHKLLKILAAKKDLDGLNKRNMAFIASVLEENYQYAVFPSLVPGLTHIVLLRPFWMELLETEHRNGEKRPVVRITNQAPHPVTVGEDPHSR